MQVSCIKNLVQIHASVLCRVGLRSIQCKKPVPEKKLESMTHAQKKLKFLVQVSGTRFFYKQRRSATIRELVTFSGRAPSDSKSSFFWLMGPPYQWAPVTRRWSNPIVTPLSNIYKLYRISQWSACLNFIGCHTAEKQLDAASDTIQGSSGSKCWILVQSNDRSDEQFFNRTWNSYREGFGDASGNFWIGNKHLHHMTQVLNQGLQFMVYRNS